MKTSLPTLSLFLLLCGCGPVTTQGLPGADGTKGTTGAVGPQGPQGALGMTGQPGVQGAAGAQGPSGSQGVQGPRGFGEAWVDSTGAVMPFSEVTDPNHSMGGLTGLVQDGSGAWWRFTEKQQPGTSGAIYVLGPAQDNNGYILEVGVVTVYASTNCTGTPYTQWHLAEGYTGASNNIQDAYFYVSTDPGIPYFVMGSNYVTGAGGGCFVSAATISVVPQGALRPVTPPAMPGVPPYHLVLF